MKRLTADGKTRSILSDRIFKYAFSNKVILEDFLQSIFEYLKIDETIKIKELSPQRLIPSNHIDNKDFYGDIVAKLENGNLINLEVYTRFNDYHFNKSFGYLCRLYSNQMKYGSKDFQNYKKVYSINIVDSFKNFKKDNSYNIKNVNKIKILHSGNIQMIIIALDEIKNDKGNDKRMIKWIRWLMAKDKEERNEISKGDENMEITSNAILEFMKTQPKSLEEYYEGKLEEEKQCRIYMEEKHVLAMLKNGISIEKIQLFSDLSKTRIEEIAKENGLTIENNKTNSEK